MNYKIKEMNLSQDEKPNGQHFFRSIITENLNFIEKGDNLADFNAANFIVMSNKITKRNILFSRAVTLTTQVFSHNALKDILTVKGLENVTITQTMR